MKLITIKCIGVRKIFFMTLMSVFLVFASNSDKSLKAEPIEMVSASRAQVILVAKAPQLWTGESKGYVSQGDPASDDIAFLVQLGRVQAAIGRVNAYDKEKGMSNPFTTKVLAGYAEIDPFVSGKSKTSLSLQPLLSEMASPETFAIIMDSARTKRNEQNAIKVKLRSLIVRVKGIVTERFPSVRSSALAMSALHREAGELLRTAVSSDGHILDISKYRDALNLMEASHRLRVNKVMPCNRSRDAIKQLKSRGPLGELLDRFIIAMASGKSGGNAGEVFETAKTLADLGESLPNDDSKICQ